MVKIIVVAIAAACLAVPALAAGTGSSGCGEPSYSVRTYDGGCPEQTKPESDHGSKPDLSSGFINRVWKIKGIANGYEDGVLDFTADRFIRIPKKYRDDDDAVVGEDSRVLVSSKTRVYDEDHHRITGNDKAAALDNADTVTVIGKVRPVEKWSEDEDGIPVPTLRAKRITITG